MDEDGETEAQAPCMLGEAAAVDVVADGNDRTVDAESAVDGGEFFDIAQDGDAIDLCAVEFRVVINEAGDRGYPSAFHEFKEDAGLSASTVDDD
jgi:hypothetical protein